MKQMRTFRLEEYMGEWEFKVRHHLTASDAQSITIEELLALGTDTDREGLQKLPLSYIETWGTRDLREAVASSYERVDADHVLAFAGAEEALPGRCWSCRPGEHAVITVPCYRATVSALSTGADVSLCSLRPTTAGRWTWTSLRGTAPSADEARRRRALSPTPPATCRTRRCSASSWRSAQQAWHPAVLRRSLPGHRGRSGADDHAGRRPTRRRPFRSTHVQVLGLPGLRVGWLGTATVPSWSGWRSASTTRRSAIRVPPSSSRPSRCGPGRASTDATVASSLPTGPCSTTSSAAGRPVRLGAAHRRLRLLPRYKGGDVEDSLSPPARGRGSAGCAVHYLGDRRCPHRPLPP